MMMHSQYLRIESLAGGVYASQREFIRAARSRLSPEGKSRGMREWRHEWLRDGLRQLQESRELVRHYRF